MDTSSGRPIFLPRRAQDPLGNYLFPEQGTLRAADLSDGDATVKAKLEQLGFTVEFMPASNPPVSQPQYTSSILQAGVVYTREQLRQLFEITDPAVLRWLHLSIRRTETFDGETRASNRFHYVERWRPDSEGAGSGKSVEAS